MLHGGFSISGSQGIVKKNILQDERWQRMPCQNTGCAAASSKPHIVFNAGRQAHKCPFDYFIRFGYDSFASSGGGTRVGASL